MKRASASWSSSSPPRVIPVALPSVRETGGLTSIASLCQGQELPGGGGGGAGSKDLDQEAPTGRFLR